MLVAQLAAPCRQHIVQFALFHNAVHTMATRRQAPSSASMLSKNTCRQHDGIGCILTIGMETKEQEWSAGGTHKNPLQQQQKKHMLWPAVCLPPLLAVFAACWPSWCQQAGLKQTAEADWSFWMLAPTATLLSFDWTVQQPTDATWRFMPWCAIMTWTLMWCLVLTPSGGSMVAIFFIWSADTPQSTWGNVVECFSPTQVIAAMEHC